MYLLAFIFLILWSAVGSFDSAYFHDKKFSLHLYADCKKEHFCHTIRAICFTVIIFSLFYKNFIGVIFWIGCLAIIIDTVFFILDIIAEKNSRKKWGGLSHGEYAAHLLSNTFHYCAITTILLAKFYLDPSIVHPLYLSYFSLILVIGGSITSIQHIWRLYKLNNYRL